MAESRILPVRTSADPNSAADINELSAEALDKGGSEQIVQITEATSPAGDDLFLMERDSDGALRRVKKSSLVGPAGITFVLRGNAFVGTKQTQILMPASATISKVIIYADTAPTGATLIVDINKNGTTIFTDQGKRPEIAISGNIADSDTPDVTALAQDDRVSVDVDQVGSTVVGGNDLMITVVFS
jgi:hypothetical protein